MDRKIIDQMVKTALAEDVAGGDITTNLLISPKSKSKAVIVMKDKDAVVCGLTIARRVFEKVDARVDFKTKLTDGAHVRQGEQIVHLSGSTRSLLIAERVALNFLSYMSAIATKTAAYVEEVKGLKVKILDTRKTTPGLRTLERYAVLCGGGENHRLNLSDMVLIKDNHRFAQRSIRSLAEMVEYAKRKTRKPVEIEIDRLAELENALEGNPDYILLDNMPPQMLSRAVKIVKARKFKKRPLLEASGGVTLKTVRPIAKSGVDRISIGGLTHSRQAVDFSLEFIR